MTMITMAVHEHHGNTATCHNKSHKTTVTITASLNSCSHQGVRGQLTAFREGLDEAAQLKATTTTIIITTTNNNTSTTSTSLALPQLPLSWPRPLDLPLPLP